MHPMTHTALQLSGAEGERVQYPLPEGSQVHHHYNSYMFIPSHTNPRGTQQIRNGTYRPTQHPVVPSENTCALVWPSFSSVWTRVMDQIQQEAGEAAPTGWQHRFHEDNPFLSEPESNIEAPDLSGIIAAAIQSHQPSDWLTTILDQEEQELTDTVLSLIPEPQRQQLVQAIRNHMAKEPTPDPTPDPEQETRQE